MLFVIVPAPLMPVTDWAVAEVEDVAALRLLAVAVLPMVLPESQVAALFDEALDGLNDHERAQLTAMLDRIRQNLLRRTSGEVAYNG